MYKIGEKLPDGTVLKTVTGETVRIDSLISDQGGQGDVYKVTWRNGSYALKWYNRTEVDTVGGAQFKTIRGLTKISNPDPRLFIWPQVLVTESGDDKTEGALFGYVMDLIPEGFYEMKHFLRPGSDPKQVTFKTFHSMIWAGMHIVSAVQALHLHGLSYKDLNPGNIVINPVRSEIRMVDCDNISVDGDPCTVSGMRGYMAPEIVRSGFKKTPNIQTDQFSLAIVLFRLFYMDHPMEGRLWERFPLVTEAVEDELYCKHPIYNMSTRDDRNRPNDVYAPNVPGRMALLPSILMEGFETTFVNGIDHETGRTPENRWMQILSAARDQLVFLEPSMETDRVVRFDHPETIPRGCLRLTISGTRRHELALYPMQSIFKDAVSGNVKDYRERVGLARVYQRRLVIQNTGEEPWIVYDPETKRKDSIQKNGFFLVKPGTQILFRQNPNGTKVVGVIDNPFVRR